MNRDEESILIKKAVKGDENAFESLLLDNQRGVYNLALKLLKNREDALDVSQEVFFKAYTKLSSFKFECRLSVWLYRMTYNKCMDVLRKQSARQETSLSYENENQEETTIDIPDFSYDPAVRFESQETRELLRTEIDNLPDEMRAALIMREYNGMSYAEIAEATSSQEGTVKSRISRARKKLAEKLALYGTFEIR